MLCGGSKSGKENQEFQLHKKGMALFSFLGTGSIKEALQKGAVVIDVRTPQEFDQGRVPDSINIPVHKIAANAERIKNMNRPIVFCCASGIRSGTAKGIMKQQGLKEVYAAGSWEQILKILSKM